MEYPSYWSEEGSDLWGHRRTRLLNVLRLYCQGVLTLDLYFEHLDTDENEPSPLLMHAFHLTEKMERYEHQVSVRLWVAFSVGSKKSIHPWVHNCFVSKLGIAHWAPKCCMVKKILVTMNEIDQDLAWR